MKKVIVLTILVLFMVLSYSHTHDPLHLQRTQLRNELILQYIMLYESANVHDVWGDSGLAYGICQWHEESFNYTKTLFKLPHLRWKNKKDQIILCLLSINSGLGKMWTTYDRAVAAADKEIKSVITVG
jgi:hypothetical protein